MIAAEWALKERGTFMAMAAHELKTPITSLLGFAELLVAKTRDTASNPEFLRQIQRSA